MPRRDDSLDEWTKVFEPKQMRGYYDGGPVPVYEFLKELAEARKRIACLDAPDIDYSNHQEEIEVLQ